MELEIINAKMNPLSDEDIRDIVEIECHPLVRKWLVEYTIKGFEEELREYKDFFSKLRGNDRVEVLVAKMNNRVVGFLALWCVDNCDEQAMSIGISVHPDYWGKNIASTLVRESIKLAKNRGVKKLIIETLEENGAMRRVAEKLGFKLETVRRGIIFKDGVCHNEVAYTLRI
ncbi:MAG: GNAT family N-acetyltransferase [Candidatus Bathyarchaeia archaeon]|nr:GNAT family N-acetyltransferase [Candidatus Bathyarchaeota archaeon]